MTLALGLFFFSIFPERLSEDSPMKPYLLFIPFALSLWISGCAVIELRRRRNEQEGEDELAE